MLVIQILFWVLLILSAIIGPWAPWSANTPPWSSHLVYVVLFACLGLATFGGGLIMVR